MCINRRIDHDRCSTNTTNNPNGSQYGSTHVCCYQWNDHF